MFVRSHRLLHSITPQHSALLHSLCLLATFMGSLTHFAHSLVGQLKILNMCSHCERVSQEQTRFSSSLETRPHMDRIEGGNVKSLWSRFSKKNRFFEEECLPKLIISRSIDAASTITFYDHLFFLLDVHHGAPRSLHIFSPH